MPVPKLPVLIAKVINKLFGKTLKVIVKRELNYTKDNLFTLNRTPFMNEPPFMEAYQKGKDTDKGRFLKGVDFEWRLHVICWAAEQALCLEGDFIEFGVRTGIFSTTILNYLPFDESRRFILIDSFAGTIPELLSENEYNREKPGQMSEALWEEVYQEVVSRNAKHTNVEVIKGRVPEVLDTLSVEKLAFASVDLNSALPEKAALEFIWERLVPGGFIVLDDYGYPGFEEQQQVHDQFAASKGTSVLCLPTCQGLIMKPKTSLQT